MDRISVIVPCYNEEEAIPVYYREMKKIMEAMAQVTFELIFVDDGSRDNTLAVMRALAQEDQRCRYLSFSRNFGKEAAMYAGLQAAEGDFVAVMDVDLQDPPALLVEMYRILTEEEYDCVASRRTSRTGEGRVKSALSDAFYGVMNRLSRTEIISGARDYRMMSRKMTDAVLEMSEYNRFSKGIFGWVGFRTKWLEFEHEDRCAGTSKWPLRKLISYSVEGITGFSVAPLSLASVAGIICCAIAMLLICFIVVRTLIFGDPVAGWPSMACIVFLVGGIQLFCTGIVGVYLSKTYLETKHRPIYILQEDSREQSVREQRRRSAALLRSTTGEKQQGAEGSSQRPGKAEERKKLLANGEQQGKKAAGGAIA